MKRAKRRCQPEPPTGDDHSGSEDEGKVLDDAPLTRVDILKIVEAVMSKFPNGGASESEEEDEGGDENPHLGKCVFEGAALFVQCDSAEIATKKIYQDKKII